MSAIGSLEAMTIFTRAKFYIESRYPDDYIEFSRKNAEEAFEAAGRIKEFVLSKIK